jgi:uncharacterized protein with HEPN domain
LPSEKPILRLEDILENIDRIQAYTREHDLSSFTGDLQCQDAVERCILRISEAARKLEGFVESAAADQPWPEIRAIGNVLRHEYENVDPGRIWKIVTNDLSPLRTSIETALNKLRSGRS